MALNLYRRHGLNCVGGRPPHSMSYESDEVRRGWKNCPCPIYASGTINGKFKRRNTERAGWVEAKALAASWESSGWGGEIPAAPPPVPETIPVTKITIDRAIQAFLAAHDGVSALNTQRKHRLMLKKLKAYSEHKAERGAIT